MNGSELRYNLVVQVLKSGAQWEGSEQLIDLLESLEEYVEGPEAPIGRVFNPDVDLYPKGGAL